uniref:Uncharacterized protein n=1 Tax=Klebsiella pneumoniae TaxID=573 RepID=A0A7M1I0K0_KLEPN|nr:hypothetical protein PMIDBGBA_05340 [Klebsiella pneumoniae]
MFVCRLTWDVVFAKTEKGLTGFCLTTNPGTAGAAYGFAEMGPWEGGQAELLRVPFADFNCLVLPLMRQKKKMIM